MGLLSPRDIRSDEATRVEVFRTHKAIRLVWVPASAYWSHKSLRLSPSGSLVPKALRGTESPDCTVRRSGCAKRTIGGWLECGRALPARSPRRRLRSLRDGALARLQQGAPRSFAFRSGSARRGRLARLPIRCHTNLGTVHPRQKVKLPLLPDAVIDQAPGGDQPGCGVKRRAS